MCRKYLWVTLLEKQVVASFIYSSLAQLVERSAVNRQVVGSSPTRGAIRNRCKPLQEECSDFYFFIILINKKGEIIIFDLILDWLYPQVCGVCGKINKYSLCSKCNIKLKKEFSFTIDNYNNDLSKNFTEHCYFFKYENLIREQIIALKFREKPYIYKSISYFLKNNKKSFEYLEKYDIIIVVPISKKRKKERGYNQSVLMVKELSNIIDARLYTNILYKMKNTVPQSSLNKKQREENVKGIYEAYNCNKIRNKKILLMDDIFTTGSTVNECANILIQNGIDRKQIGVLTIAKD